MPDPATISAFFALFIGGVLAIAVMHLTAKRIRDARNMQHLIATARRLREEYEGQQGYEIDGDGIVEVGSGMPDVQVDGASALHEQPPAEMRAAA